MTSDTNLNDTKMKRITILAGARPNFVKVAPLIRAIEKTEGASWQLVYAGRADDPTLEPTLFSDGGTKTTWNLDKDDARLGVIKNVSFRNITKKSMWADPDGKQSVSWYFKEYSGNTVMVYTSPYCDFAARTLPQGKVNITGIVKRFNNSWEFVVRSLDDVEELE